MYVVLCREGHENLPTVMSKNSNLYPDFIQAGYEIIFEGCRKDCYEVYDNMLVENYA